VPDPQSQGGQGSPGSQLGQAQVQPSPSVDAVWQTPETQGSPSVQGMPRAIHVQTFAVSARHAVSSVCCKHGSLEPSHVHGSHVWSGGHTGHEHVSVVVAAPPSQVQSHGGHESPVQSGQTQVQVPAGAQPVPPQSHAHGGHTSPGGHVGQSHVHVPPPPSPPSQSHSHGGQSAPSGQYAGHTQAQPSSVGV